MYKGFFIKDNVWEIIFMKENVDELLLLDEQDAPIILEEECKELKPLVTEFMQAYVENKDVPTEIWLEKKLQEKLPEKSVNEIAEITKEIVETIAENEKNKKSLEAAIKDGRSKESWFASTLKGGISGMSTHASVEYLSNLDVCLQNANESLLTTITTQAGTINQNPCLDGYIAEQYHAQTFNMNAEASGSQYRAKVLEPKNGVYTKNSVDIVIVDSNGTVVKRYQSKYCKDAKATEKAFARGDYRGQQKLVPEEQLDDIAQKASAVIEAPDGTKSNPLTKTQAGKMRDEAQSGKWNELNWNEYQVKDLAIGIGKQAGYAALQGAVISVGFDVAQKLWNEEEIEAEDVVKAAISGGADFGVKAAAAGALKVGVEKGIISVIPKGTPASTFANIAYVAIENVKVVGDVVTGKLSIKEGLDKMEQTTVSVVAGLALMGKGAEIGASIGTVFGPIGTAIGGFIGGTVGYMAGSQIGDTLVKGVQKMRQVTKDVVKKVGSGIERAVSSVAEGIKNIFSFAF